MKAKAKLTKRTVMVFYDDPISDLTKKNAALLAALETCRCLLESAALKSVDPSAVDERSAAIGKARAAIKAAGGGTHG